MSTALLADRLTAQTDFDLRWSRLSLQGPLLDCCWADRIPIKTPFVAMGTPARAAQRERSAAIPPEEDAVSIDAAIALRDTFAKESPAMRALFDALVDLLTGGGRKH
jgi:hypothetical protein